MTRDRLALPQVTLCAVTSVNLPATVRALEVCLNQISFGDCVLLTDAPITAAHPEIRVVPINRIDSSASYSRFLLSDLADHVTTDFCLVSQWDGHVLDKDRWRQEFLDYDYIGASWPQFADGHDVGNGGFSLRSRRLLELCRQIDTAGGQAEDTAIGRTNRTWLEGRGIRFADRALADLFSAERAGNLQTAFGYHGVWNMPGAIGLPAFWEVYRGLDDRNTVRHDFFGLVKDVSVGEGGSGRVAKMLLDRLRDILTPR